MIQTHGFQVSVLPQVPNIDPRPYGSAMANIFPGIQQGVGLYSGLQQIAEDQRLRPIKDALQQIALQDAQNKLANAPLERQLQQIKLAAASQPIDSPEGISVVDQPRASPFAPEDTPADYVPPSDRYIEQSFKVFDPVTRTEKIEKRRVKVEQTAEQLAMAQDAADTKRMREESLAESRNLANQLAQERLSNPNWHIVGTPTVDPETGFAVYIQNNPKTGETRYVKTQSKPVDTGANALINAITSKFGGGSAGAPPTGATPLAAPMFNLGNAAAPVGSGDPEVDALIKQFAPAATGGSYASPDDVKAAFASGKLSKDDAAKILREQFGFQ